MTQLPNRAVIFGPLKPCVDSQYRVDSSVSVQAVTYDAANKQAPTRAWIQCVTGPVSIRTDGTDPSASEGFILSPGWDVMLVLEDITLIRMFGGIAEVQVYF